MPAPRRTPLRARRPSLELTDGVRMLLTTGAGFALRLERGLGSPHITDDEIRQLWESHGEQITREWIEAKPGSRPWGWWQFASPERRRCINGVHPHDRADRGAYIAETDKQFPGFAASATRLCFGMPSTGIPEFHDEDCEYETEAAFLDRLGLWAPGEREKWAVVPKGTCDACFQ